MVPVVKFTLSVLFSTALATALAQKPVTGKPNTGAIQKFKPPKLTSTLGIRSDSAVVTLEEAVQLIKFPLKITDAKKTAYTISSYQVMYKRTGGIQNEETGKITPVTSNVADLFRETPLPELWKKILAEQMKPGEELFFFDIIAKDPQGRLMFAPDLIIKIK